MFKNLKLNRDIVLYYLYSFFSNLQLHGVIFALYMKKEGLNLFQIGIVLSSFQISKLLFEVPSGYMADKYGRKLTCVLGQSLFLCFFLLILFNHSFYGFIISNIIQGICATLFSGTIEAIFVDIIMDMNEEKSLSVYNSIDRFLFFVATGIASFLGGLIAFYNYVIVFKISLFIQLLALFTLLFIRNFTPSNKEEGNAAEELSFVECFKLIIENKALIYLLMIDIFIAIIELPFEDYYPNILKAASINEMNIGVIMSIQLIISGVIGLFNKKVTDKIGDLRVVRYFQYFIPGILIVTFILHDCPYINACLFTIVLCVISINSAVKYKYLQDNIESRYRATMLSVRSLLVAVVAIIVNPLVGFVSERLGFDFIFIILGIVAITFMIINNALFGNKVKYEKYGLEESI